MASPISITVNGEPGTRLSVRCRCCKERWTHEVTRKAWDGVRMAGQPVTTLGFVHSCPKVDGWRKAGHPEYLIQNSALRFESILWKPRADGSVTKCGGACRSAKGPNCDCHCRGEFHGAGAARILDLDDVDAIIRAQKARE
jgi:hypothetical protein